MNPLTRWKWKRYGIDVAPEMNEALFDAEPRNQRAMGFRIAASIAAGFVVSVLSFLYMNQNLSHIPDWPELEDPGVLPLEIAMDKAREYIDNRDYELAIAILTTPMEEAPGGSSKEDAAFLLLEAEFLNFMDAPNQEYADSLHGDLNETMKLYFEHERTPDAIYWQAQVYRWENEPKAALTNYENIINNYNVPIMDRLLYEATELAMETKDPRRAANLAQQMLAEHPGSNYGARARLLLGDAYAQAGMTDESRTLYRRVADDERLGAARANAILRLGQHAYDTGQYEDAIRDLSTYLSLSTESEGARDIYLLLGKAYRQADELEKARDTLNSLLNFFEPSDDFTPGAMIEYSQVLDTLGDHKGAMEVAMQVTGRYPNNPDGHKNRGFLLGLSGNAYGAAVSLLEADTQGAQDPGLVLLAARHLESTGMFSEALKTYRMLQEKYAGTHDAVEGNIEMAELMYQEGQIMEAIDELEELTTFTSSSVHYVPALVKLANIYTDLDFQDELKATAQKIADKATEAKDLTAAALALFNMGEMDRALEISDRIPLGQLGDREAYALLLNQGEALRQLNPKRALETLEEAYLGYPDARTLPGDAALLVAYLDGGRTTAARRMVMELQQAIQANPKDTPHYIDASIMWGDYLYGREDYRSAADAFKKAIDVSEQGRIPYRGIAKDVDWAKYQRANALLALSEFSESLTLLEEIAASDAAWAAEAATKAEYVKLEQQVRNRQLASSL